MTDGGKGDDPRPRSVPRDVWDRNWARTFREARGTFPCPECDGRGQVVATLHDPGCGGGACPCPTEDVPCWNEECRGGALLCGRCGDEVATHEDPEGGLICEECALSGEPR